MDDTNKEVLDLVNYILENQKVSFANTQDRIDDFLIQYSDESHHHLTCFYHLLCQNYDQIDFSLKMYLAIEEIRDIPKESRTSFEDFVSLYKKEVMKKDSLSKSDKSVLLKALDI